MEKDKPQFANNMKTFNFTEEEKIKILNYLLSHRMKRKEEYSDTQWEKIKKQRIRAREPIKKLLNSNPQELSKTVLKLNFDNLTYSQRLGIDDNNEVFHIPVDILHLNEEITNLLRKIIKINSKYVW